MRYPRGSVVWVDLGGSVGSEQDKRRPALVVSNDGANRSAEALGRGVITIVPLTSSGREPRIFQVSIPRSLSRLSHDSVAQCEQVRSVDVRRLTPTGQRASESVMGEINQALRLHLHLW